MEEDTIQLLRECNVGIKMGVHTIDEVMDKVQDKNLIRLLESSKDEHARLGDETHDMLQQYGEEGKEASPMAKGMSKMKSEVKMAIGEKDETAADLISDGCHMGIKSLSKYLNQYCKAEERAKDIAKKLIHMEESLEQKLRTYL